MLKITTNADVIAKKMDSVAKGLPKANIDAIKQATRFGEMLAKSMAPVGMGIRKRSIGSLKKNITRTPIVVTGKMIKSSVISWASGGSKNFPYHFWVNASKGYESVLLPKSGGGRQKRTYASTRHTGVPGYFTKTARMMRRSFTKLVIKENMKNLRKFRGK